jgi:hypothetical protein
MVLETWHLTPEYINENWTEELLALMLKARVERLNRLAQPVGYKAPINDGKYRPEHHADVTSLAGKMTGFGSRAFEVIKR